MKLAKDKWWAFDKALHTGRGMLIYALIHIAFPTIWGWVPFVAAWGFAGLYELKDGLWNDGFSFKDWFCDTAGAGSVWLLWALRM